MRFSGRNGSQTEEYAALAHRVVERWEPASVVIRPGVSVPDIDRFERRYDVRLPSDLRVFLTVVNGMSIDEMDPVDHFRFWPLEEIRPVPEEVRDDPEVAEMTSFFVIADYSVWAHAYAIQLSDNPEGNHPVVLIGTDEPRCVAPSFHEFLKKYLDEPDALF